MDKSIEKLAEEQGVNVYVALKFYDLGRQHQHGADVERLEARVNEFTRGLFRKPWLFCIYYQDWQAFKEMKLE